MVLSMDRWVGKVAVVTGCSSGIGAAIAEILVDKGLIVAGIARRVEVVEQKAKTLIGRKGKLHAVKADITNEDDVIKAFKWICSNLGPVNILVNNAGVAKENFLSDGDAKEWKQTFDINVIGLCVATREAVKSMKANNINGQIIHINSTVGHKIPFFPGVNVYTASKFAVTALAETLRHEFIHNNNKIKVTSISPGLVASEMTTLNTGFSKERSGMLKSAPILQPRDIAEGICYVLSVPEHVQINELTITPLGERI